MCAADNNVKYAKFFKLTLKDFLSDFKDNIFTNSDEQLDLATGLVALEYIPPLQLAKSSMHMLEYKDEIIARNEHFFLERDSLFAGLPSTFVTKYKSKIMSDPRISEDEKNIAWDYITMLLEYLEKIDM
jgi:hypothetical protein